MNFDYSDKENKMALDLRENEVVLSEVDFHWLSYLTSGFFMVIGAAFFLTGFADMELYLFLLGFCLILPFFYVYLSNRYKIYLVTNERVFIRTGIIFCNEKDIPIAKINDVLLQQGFLQMIFGAGDILIQVGNDSGTLIKDVQNAKEFKEAIIMAINNLNHGSRRNVEKTGRFNNGRFSFFELPFSIHGANPDKQEWLPRLPACPYSGYRR